MKKTYLILLFTFVIGCLPTEQRVAPNFSDLESNTSVTDNTGGGTVDSGDGSTTVFQNGTQWFDSGLTLNTLTIGSNNAKTIYLLGDEVNDYLLNTDNYNATYCLEARFQNTSTNSPKILRVKVVPAFSNNFIVGQTTRFFRVNLNTDSGNSFCNLPSEEVVNGSVITVPAGDSDYDGVPDVTYAYQTEDICPGCLNIVASTSVILYKNNENNTSGNSTDDYLQRVDTTQVTYQDLILRIDMNNTSGGTTNSCSDVACQANGFDCCVDGQCVNEKSIKIAGVQADQAGFAVAEQEKFTNPNWFKNYPQFYYICLEATPGDDGNTGGGSDPDDPIGDAQTRLNELKSDWRCVENLKASSVANPFHLDAVGNATICSVADDTTSTDNSFENIFKRLYTNCGCSESSDLSAMINACPDYTYDPVYQVDSNGNQTTNIISISCVTPPVEQVPGPFQDLDVIVNSKVAPHRFFDTTGAEIIPGQDLPTGATGVQEGDKFEYLDDFYIFPRNFSYNMNSLLGEFNVALSKAQPAVVVDVDFDKQYLISTLSGFYSACTTCAVDSWFNNFSANPGASRGVGLQAVGYTTSRDTFDTNTTLGNYEDTIFGRACYVPPTMIPFSHTEGATQQLQRQTRLKTQSALYMNGYQKDWYGFNRGALIGSFDGVTWFAVGKGRIVKSTSNKLFLAINAPFADLSTPTNHTVAIQEYDFVSSAPNHDYVPGLEINNAFQNEAGSCQEFHLCETDANCISKLGWEYVCADVTTVQTKWPQFEPIGASENANTSFTGSIEQFLQQGSLPPSGGTKRCVYRGAGAPCRTDYENISDEGVRKHLTCAPNFYCADLDTTGVFNDEIARFGRPLEELVESNNHLYGQEANVLGRPKDYIAIGSNLATLPSDIKAAIESNVLLTDPTAAGNVGLCRPGKRLPSYATATTTANWDPADQHANADTEYRTDYISQIGSCNSALYTDLRYSSCPMLDEEGNYIHTQDSYINNSFYSAIKDANFTKMDTTELYSSAQNVCSLESLDSAATIGSTASAATLKDLSAFKLIEGETLALTSLIVEPTLARDACFRRAGSVCHTDLDCSPNKMMASVIDLVNPNLFGNEAEKIYHEEYLICGQAERAPASVLDANFNTYNIENNRCCRELGADLTMFTEDSPAEPISTGLRTDLFASQNPNNPNRYSRYSSDPTLFTNGAADTSGFVRPSANTNTAADANITKPLQWRTIHENAARICCGGNWVRKFADGTNDWTKKRLTMDVNNFRCLNYNSPIALTDTPSDYNLTSAQIDSGLNNFCADPNANNTDASATAQGGCIERPDEIGIPDFDGDPIKPKIDTTTVKQTIFTLPADMDTRWNDFPWAFHKLLPVAGGSSDLILDWTVATEADATRKAIRTTLPPFITYDNFDSEIEIRLKLPTNEEVDAVNNVEGGGVDLSAGNYHTCSRIDPNNVDPNDVLGLSPTPVACSSPDCGISGEIDDWEVAGFFGVCDLQDGLVGQRDDCCFIYDEINRNLIIAFERNFSLAANSYGNADNVLGAQISWSAPGTEHWENKKAVQLGSTTAEDQNMVPHRRSSTRGEALYYLEKLSRLEYAGIPQMTYEPVYCNDNYQKLVPGVFQEAPFGQQLQNVIDFINHPKTFEDPSAGAEPWQEDTTTNGNLDIDTTNLNRSMVTTGDMLTQAPIFSDNKFKCCLELGSSTDDASLCCSGYAVQDSSNPNLTCKLPTGTNLNVYFNKFVSGEGLSSTYSPIILEEDDFDPRTGEPRINSTVIAKVVALGEAFCESGATRRGGVFGNFEARPLGPLQVTNGVDGTLQYTMVDSIFDERNVNGTPVGYSWFNGGFKWNHHTYCAPDGN